jgi:hypothetical protein
MKDQQAKRKPTGTTKIFESAFLMKIYSDQSYLLKKHQQSSFITKNTENSAIVNVSESNSINRLLMNLEDKSDAAMSSCFNRQFTDTSVNLSSSYARISNSFLNDDLPI